VRSRLLLHRPHRWHRRMGLELVIYSGLCESDDLISSSSLCIWTNPLLTMRLTADAGDTADAVITQTHMRAINSPEVVM